MTIFINHFAKIVYKVITTKEEIKNVKDFNFNTFFCYFAKCG